MDLEEKKFDHQRKRDDEKDMQDRKGREARTKLMISLANKLHLH